MTFIPVDLITWERKEYYHHFTKNVMCNYALTIPIDITALQGERLYPAMLWLKTFLPLSLQIHHAACDGYHASLFVNTLQNKIDAWSWKCKK